MQFTNPIIPGFYPDPSVCRVGEDYYLVTSSFEYFPGVPIFHSRDLVNWEQIGHCLSRESQLNLEKAAPSGGIYAPTIRCHNGLFYMVTTNVSHGGNFYVTAKDPAGQWSEPIWVDLPLIDPTLFFDDDGKVYFTCVKFDGDKTYGAGLSEIDIATGKILTEHRMIWTGSGGSFPEAPHIYKLNGFYYLMLAEGGTHTGHMVTIARSKNIWGPYEGCPHNPILTHRQLTGKHPIQAAGHGDLVQAHDGSWWIVFLGIRHGNRQPRFHNLGRESFLAPVEWNKDGWPVVNGGKVVELLMPAPNLKLHPFEKPPIRDDFDAQQLNFCWNFLRNARPGSWSLHERPGFLTLHGSEVTLNDVDSPAFAGRRQQHTNCRVSALLEFDPKISGEEAGLTVMMNNGHHYEAAVIKEDGKRRIILRRRIGKLCVVEANEQLQDGRVILEIQADKQNYFFRYGIADLNGTSSLRELGWGETRYLSTEAAGGFTGVYFGMYSTGNGKPSSPAAFDWFDYVPLPD